jgi:hypothetical protein
MQQPEDQQPPSPVAVFTKRPRSGLSKGSGTMSTPLSDRPSETTEQTSSARYHIPIPGSLMPQTITPQTPRDQSTLSGITGSLMVTPDSVGALYQNPLLQMHHMHQLQQQQQHQLQQRQQHQLMQLTTQFQLQSQSPYLSQHAPLNQTYLSRNAHLGMGQPGFSLNTPMNPYFGW